MKNIKFEKTFTLEPGTPFITHTNHGRLTIAFAKLEGDILELDITMDERSGTLHLRPNGVLIMVGGRIFSSDEGRPALKLNKINEGGKQFVIEYHIPTKW